MGKTTALVLEGGSLRCMFAAGIIDVLMENDIKVDGLFGVSAGALVGINYVSWQPGRTKKVNVDFSSDSDYYGLHTFLKHKSAFNMDYLFGTICDVYLPLDRETFINSTTDFTTAATDCETGEPVYFSKKTCSDIFMAVRASASMPLLTPMVEVEGRKCLDGGLSVPIPYQKAIDEGYDRILVIPSREQGFRKPMSSAAMDNAVAKKYRDYPKLVRAFVDMPRVYAEEAYELDRLSYEKRVMMLRPPCPVNVSRTEKDSTKLIMLYRQGRRIAEERLSEIAEYLA